MVLKLGVTAVITKSVVAEISFLTRIVDMNFKKLPLIKILPLIVFFVLMAITTAVWYQAKKAANDAYQEHFDFRVRETITDINSRMDTYQQALHGTRGLYLASDTIKRNEFRDYVFALYLEENFPGIQGVGYSVIVPPDQKESHIAAVRNEGYPEYNIRPEEDRDLYTSIVFLEPLADRNLRAFGYDMFSEPVRRAAMERSRDTDMPAMSGKVRLVQEYGKKEQAGFLIYIPVYRNEFPSDTLNNRQANIIGWVYSPFRMDDLMQGILGEHSYDINVEIFDGQVSKESLMYDSENSQDIFSLETESKDEPNLVSQKKITIADHDWLVSIQARSSLFTRVGRSHMTLILFFGITLSILSAWLSGLLITGREQALKMASEKTKQYRFLHNIIESLPYPFYVINAKNYALILTNSAASPGKEWPGKTCYNLTHKRDTPCEGKEHKCTLEEVLRTKGPVTVEHLHYDAENNPRYIEVSGYPIFDEKGNVTQLIEYAKDITGHKQAEEEKTKLEDHLQQAQKMESIGTLAGGIAHDFNNMLGAILGYTEMARNDSPSGSTVVKDLDKVLEAGNRAKGLVKQILAFSYQGATEHIPIQPSSILKEAVEMLRPSLPTTIEINQNIDSKTGLILADPTQINQIVMNLCTNAFHAMEVTGGILDISLKETCLSTEDLVHEPDTESGNFIQLSVCDSGPGMTPEIKGKIFDPYFTTKETGKGTGMGLSIIHGIVKSYGGFISLYSELGEGTTFHVFLPVMEKDTFPQIETVKQLVGGKERVLFIDDEDILAEMGKYMLERLGYQVTIRNSSLDALETFQNQPDQFDIVITDQTMPGMTGADLARRMMQIRPDIPIILCTGYSAIVSEEKAKGIGIKEFAMKPLAQKDISKLIRKVLDTA